MSWTSDFFRPCCRRFIGALLTLSLIFLVGLAAGCGSSPVRRSAKNQISAAKNSIESAKNWMQTEDYGSALSCLQEAEDQRQAGLKHAREVEKRTLKSIQEEINKLKAEAESLQKVKAEKDRIKQAQAEEEALIAAEKKKEGKKDDIKEKVEAVDPSEMLKNEDKEKKTTIARDAEKDLAVLEANDKKTKTTEETEAETAEVKKNAEEEGGDAVKPTAVVQKGPFRAYGENAPDISIDKVSSNGDFALAYIQLFNLKSDTGKRIGRVEVVFRDDGNGTLMDTRFVFEYEKFKMDAKDLTDQPDGSCAITAASHSVPGHGSLKLIAVAQDARYAKKATKAAVTVHFEDGSSASDTGPNSISNQEKSSPLPGL